ncbi:MAG: glycosyltransferase [Gemmatimonadaceae bacterium]
MRRLLIISDMAHYHGDAVVGWGPTVQEIDHLAQLFDEVRHIAFLYEGPAPDSMIPYTSPRVRLVPVPPSGGNTVRRKLGVMLRLPSYARTVLAELSQADVVHLRCPASVSLIGLMLLTVLRRPHIRWVKYAGAWQPRGRDPLSYALQRWWILRGFQRGAVTVNGRWPGQPVHIRSFHNPCLTSGEREEARIGAEGKQLGTPARLLFVGAMVRNKQPRHAVQILASLRRRGIDAVLDMVGDGQERVACERLASELGVASRVVFHGWLPRPAIATFYAGAHLLLVPSESEGWPKVLSEGMAHGVVPVASAVGSIAQHLSEFGVGKSIDPSDLEGFAEAVTGYLWHPGSWKEESRRAIGAAAAFSYEKYLDAVAELLDSEQRRVTGDGAEPFIRVAMRRS